jgi:predicted MFS family arabinose efflux permease
VSSRIGAKRTLITGLAIIVVFSALAGLSGSIGGIVGFRAGWGLGNALFIATSLAVIVASASGGFAGAIVMYEAALGLGIAAGPLVGGLLGDVSWRGPFFGVAVLMAIALIATVVLLEPTPKPARPTSLSAPLKALRHRSLLTMSVTALLYNWGFFTMLGYAPYPMELDAIQLGFVFFGWGLLVAFFAVIGAPRLQARFGTAPSLYGALGFFAVLMVLIGVFTDVRWALIVCVVASGIVVRSPRRRSCWSHRSSGRSPRPRTASSGSSAAGWPRSPPASSPSTSASTCRSWSARRRSWSGSACSPPATGC